MRSENKNQISEFLANPEKYIPKSEKMYVTHKLVEDIKFCNLELDSISLLGFLCETEFKAKPHFIFSHSVLKNGHVNTFKAVIELNIEVIGIGQGSNKKEAKYDASKAALSIIAPMVFSQKFSGEKMDTDKVI